ncbi:hypothetical protein RDV89_17860 [Nocardioides zeae]|uniref:Helix-turn-helix domain-containing protein n=1 Tax=Nocardioides imazamoxiresistens TaxID=3231893 RepID=A0ABU3Q0P3_9ACTN|nr:hypothetical protein [Nocardioides zeae]MDT9594959.1 hypothetical protein [Nocardioides zeae]
MPHVPLGAAPWVDRLASTPVRRSFVVLDGHLEPDGHAGHAPGSPGVLGTIVRGRRRRALDAYLLLLALWPWLEQQEQPLTGADWAVALSCGDGTERTPGAVSSAWHDLELLGLVERRRIAHGVVVSPRREDAGGAYARPAPGTDEAASCLWLPTSFWTDGWHRRLGLPALAMLLAVGAATAERPDAALTNHGTARQLGFSPRSVQTGLAELERHGLVVESRGRTSSPRSATASAPQHRYRLAPTFVPSRIR